MLNINLNQLNPLESSIHQKLCEVMKTNDQLKILEAAEYCGVSPSKISKLARKLGFENFKQYKQYISGEQLVSKKKSFSSELKRIQDYIEHFDHKIVDTFVEMLEHYDKIVLFGLGPSFICVEYFAYKLNLVLEKNVFATHSNTFAQHLVDEDTLFIVFSVTGKFTSFDTLLKTVKSHGADVLLILEEYNRSVAIEAENIIYLTKSTQNEDLLPYEKTRTIFFIFIEEVFSKLMSKRKKKNPNPPIE